MNRIVKRHVPASDLPPAWRAELSPTVAQVTVTVEEEIMPPERVMTLEEILARRRPPFRSSEDIDAELARLRDEWER